MPNPVVAYGGAAVGSAIIGGIASSKSADAITSATENATDKSVAEQRRQFDKMLELTAPWRESGVQALNQLNSVLYPQKVWTPDAYNEELQSVTNRLQSLREIQDTGSSSTATTSANGLSEFAKKWLGTSGGNLTSQGTPAPATQAQDRTIEDIIAAAEKRPNSLYGDRSIQAKGSSLVPPGTWDQPEEFNRIKASLRSAPTVTAAAPKQSTTANTTQSEIASLEEYQAKLQADLEAEMKKRAEDPEYAAEQDRLAATPSAMNVNALREIPGYQFAVQEGQQGLDRSLAARGMTRSGAYDKATMRFRQGLADQNYNNYLNPYFNMAGMGQVSAGQAAQGAQAMGNQLSQLYTNQGYTTGAARASNYANQANIYGNLLNNLAGGYAASQYMK